MKRIILLLLTILLTKTISFSSNISEITQQDSIVYVTSDQLKYTNLIFNEHKKLLEENTLLGQQLENYRIKTNYLLQEDSLKTSQIEVYKRTNEAYAIWMQDLNETIKKKDKTITCWKIGSITVTVGLLILLLK